MSIEQMHVVYKIDITDTHYTYAVDNSDFHLFFDRLAYKIELLHPLYGHYIITISMNPFTNDVKKLGVPSDDSHAFNQKITNVTVESNTSNINCMVNQ